MIATRVIWINLQVLFGIFGTATETRRAAPRNSFIPVEAARASSGPDDATEMIS